MAIITFSKPFDLRNLRTQGAIAYVSIYVGKLIGATGKAPPSITKGKKKAVSKKFKKIGEVPYKNMSAFRLKDKKKGLDEAKITFANVELSDGETLLDLFLEGDALEIVWGVRGLWHLRRRMMIREVSPDYGAQTSFVVTAHGSAVKLVDVEDVATYNGQRVSDIVKNIAASSGMRASVDIKSDPVITHLTSGRRSPMEVLFDMAEKYGYLVRVINDVVYFNEMNTKGQPVRRFDFAGPRGNMLSFKAKSSISGIRGATTKAKTREDTGKTKAKETAPARSLRIDYKDKGDPYTARVVVRNPAKPAKPQQRTNTTDRNKRTVHTLRKGTAAERVALGKHLNRTLKAKKASFVTINEYLTPNTNVLIGNLNSKYNGRYLVGDVLYDFRGGIWLVTVHLSAASTSSKANKKDRKGAKNPNNRKGKATPNPKLLVKYKRNGTYDTKRIATGQGKRGVSR